MNQQQRTTGIPATSNKLTGRQPTETQLRSPVQVPEHAIEKQLIWSSRKPDDWEILVYRHGTLWEACFFRWAIHHEHAIASSFEAVCQRAEQRIRALEDDRLKSTVWKRIIH